MIDLPFCAYLLTDRMSLVSYDQGDGVITPNDIVRHLFTLKRDRDKLKPDYCLIVDFEKEKEYIGYDKEDSLRFYLVKVFQYLAKRYLFLHCGQLYVKDDMVDEWMEFVRVFPPLMIEAAFFVDDCQFKGDECKLFKEFFVPIFGNSAMRKPYNCNLEKYVREEGGLSDLHVHINGTSETDMVWWSQLGRTERWVSNLRSAWEQENAKRQHEQISDVPIEYSIKRIRKIKDLLRKIVAEMCERSEWNILFGSLTELLHAHNEECPILAKGAYFYWKLFTLMQGKCFSENIVHNFYEMILILGYVHEMMVQQWTQKGFSQFQLITKNNLRNLHEEQHFQERFMQLGLDNDMSLLKYVEVRFSPSAKLTDNITYVSNIVRGFEKLKDKTKEMKCGEPELRLIAHFTKKEERRRSGYCRHCALRFDIMRKAISLWKLNKYLLAKRQNPIVGIDAASNEMHAGPEVFSPSFRLLRGLMRTKENTDLHFTYHAGEDFRHLLSGLRAMAEAVDFLEMEQGDRIGHGTAAGIDPALWIDRMGDVVKLSKGEWLDNLLMVYDLASKDNVYSDLTKLLPNIHNEIEDIHTEIYGGGYSVSDMLKAWKCRKYNPEMYLHKKQNYYSLLCECEDSFQNKKEYAIAREIYEKYHYDDDVKAEYVKTIEINLKDSLFDSENLRHIQNLVLNKIALKKIAIEVLFTSNLAISFYAMPQEHHLKRWLDGGMEGSMIRPPLVLGSDDPGIFMTNIYIEYSRIMKYLESYGFNFNERLRILNDFTQTSKYYKFG